MIAVGNPFGLSGTATAGIVSAFGRNDGSQGFVDYMQIDAPINHGNSGGPTFDLYGRVIGVNAAIITPSGASAGIGFAIPADIAYNITQKLIKGGKVDRGYIGVQISSVSEDEAEALGTKDLNGAYISNVTKGGPADKAGIQAGDIVRAVNGEAVKTSADLTKKVAQFKPGDKMVLSIYRGGKLVQITVTSGLRPSEDKLALGELEDRVSGLRAGADDYLVKPYALSELVARIEVLARRKDASHPDAILRIGELEMNLIARSVKRAGQAIDLQPREFQLLEFLMRHAGQSVTRTMLLEKVWAYHFDPQTNVIDVHISRLRAKLDKGFDRPMLHTVRREGYQLNP